MNDKRIHKMSKLVKINASNNVTKPKIGQKYKNNGTCIVVQFVAPNTTTSALKSLVEYCIDCDIFDKTIHRVSADGGVKEQIYRYAFMSFPSSSAAFNAKCTLDNRKVDGSILRVSDKKSREELQAQREAEREKRKLDFYEFRRQQWKAQRKVQRQQEYEQRKQEYQQRKVQQELQQKEYETQQALEAEANKVYNEKKQKERQERDAFRALLNFRNTDWNCSKCTTINFVPRTVCFKCKAERVIPKEVLEAEKKNEQIKRERRERERMIA